MVVGGRTFQQHGWVWKHHGVAGDTGSILTASSPWKELAPRFGGASGQGIPGRPLVWVVVGQARIRLCLVCHLLYPGDSLVATQG